MKTSQHSSSKLVAMKLMGLLAIAAIANGAEMEWPMKIILNNANVWVYDITSDIIDSFQNGLLDRFQNEASPSCTACNGTMIANLTGKLGKYGYSASTVATAIALFGKDITPSSSDYRNMLTDGTGLVPISCAVIPPASNPAPLSSFHCNIIAKPTTFSVRLGDVITNQTYAANRPGEFRFASPMTLSQIENSPRSLVPFDMSNVGVVAQDENGLTDVVMLAFVVSDDRVVKGSECKNTSLVIQSLESQMVGGDHMQCSSWSDTVLIVQSIWPAENAKLQMDITNCANAPKKGVVSTTILFPKSYDVDGTQPFAYAVIARDGSVLCTYGMYQSTNPAGNNYNSALLFAFNTTLPSLQSCSESYSWSYSPDYYRLNYTMSVLTPAALINISQMYTSLNSQSYSLNITAILHDADTAFVGPSASSEESCLWKKVEATGGIIPSDVISVATRLMYTSAKGVSHTSQLGQGINTIENQVGSFNIFNALTTGMASIAAGIGVNVFRVPFKRMGTSTSVMFGLRLTISIVEAAFVNLPTFTYMVLLAKKGKSSYSIDWSDVYPASTKEYPIHWSLFVGTQVTLVGKADLYNVQWAVLALTTVVSTLLVMHRWHRDYTNEFADRRLLGIQMTGIKSDDNDSLPAV